MNEEEKEKKKGEKKYFCTTQSRSCEKVICSSFECFWQTALTANEQKKTFKLLQTPTNRCTHSHSVKQFFISFRFVSSDRCCCFTISSEMSNKLGEIVTKQQTFFEWTPIAKI